MKKPLITFLILFPILIYSIDIKDIFKSVYKNDFSLKKAYYETLKAKYLSESVAKGKLPDLKVTHISTKLDETSGFNIGPTFIKLGDKNSDITKFVATSVLYAGGKINALKKISRLGEKIAELNFELVKKSEYIEALNTYIEILKVGKLKEISEESLKILNAHLKDAKIYVKNGILLDSDLLRIKVKISEAEKNMEDLKNAENILKSKFEKITGKSFDDFKELKLNFKVSIKDLVYYLKNIEKREEFKIIKLTENIENIKIKIEKSENLPSLVLNYENHSGSIYDDGDSGYSVSLIADYKFYDFGKTASKTRARVYSDLSYKAAVNDVKENLKLEIKNLYYKLISAKNKIKISKVQIKNGKRNLEIITQKYKQGAATNTDFLDAQLDYTKAKTDYAVSYYDMYETYFKLLKASHINEKFFEIKEEK